MAKAIVNASADIMQGFAQKYIDAMNATFDKYGIWKRLFSVGSVKDEATCMIYRNGKWEIFFSERDSAVEPEFYDDDNISEACMAMIRRVPDEKEDVPEMLNYYHALLNKSSRLGFRVKDIEKIISKYASAASLF